MFTLMLLGIFAVALKALGLVTKIWIKIAAFGFGALLVLIALMII